MSLILVAGSDGEGPSGTLPPRGTRPNVGLMPATPQSAAGIRMEPPVSVATAAGTSPAATAAADPPLEPPQMKSGLCGFLVPEPLGSTVVMPQPNSCERVSPTITAPARLSRLTTSESADATAPARAMEP